MMMMIIIIIIITVILWSKILFNWLRRDTF